MRIAAGATLGLAILLSGASLAAFRQPLRVIDSVDLSRYAGKWYEAARLPNKFQRDCVSDVVAQYRIRPDARIDVQNECRHADGSIDRAVGLGRKAGSGKNDAVLEVRFAPAILSFLPNVWGDYWIIGLGPDYSWAVVGTPSREYLWILSRVPNMTTSSYEQALEIARGNGFDTSQLVRTLHTK